MPLGNYAPLCITKYLIASIKVNFLLNAIIEGDCLTRRSIVVAIRLGLPLSWIHGNDESKAGPFSLGCYSLT